MRYSRLGAQQAHRNGVGARGARSRSAGTALGSRLGRAWTGAQGARVWQASGSGAGVRRRSGRAGAGARAAGERQARGARGREAGARGTAGSALRCPARGLGVAGRGARGLGLAGRWARGLGARVGQDCALGALDLIFKPVFRLSIFPESVNEHCSL